MDILERRSVAERVLDRVEHSPSLGALLAPLAFLYALGGRLLRVVRPDTPLPASPPSIGVGNLRVGGTGKTPVVADLATRFSAAGRRVAVLTRAYRGEGGGDEPGWLEAQGLDVHCDADRARAFQASATAQLIFLDDSLQTRHRPRIQFAIVLEEDLSQPPRCLPAGPAREGATGLARAQAILIRRPSTSIGPYPRLDERPHFAFSLRPVELVDAKDGMPVVPADLGEVALVSGLARPQSFERDAASLGLELRGSARFPDHARIDAGQRRELAAWLAELKVFCLVTTEKNAARLVAAGGIEGVRLIVLRSEIKWEADPYEWLQDRIQTA